MKREDRPPPSTAPAQTGAESAQELLRRGTQMRGMGGAEKRAERKRQGPLNARERIDLLLDPGSFLETGLHAASYRPELRDATPADGKVSGSGKIDGRDVALVSSDFTVMGASSSHVNGLKIGHLKQIATRRGLPMVFLGESTGARMPDAMGVAVASGDRPTQYLRTRETPWATTKAMPRPCWK